MTGLGRTCALGATLAFAFLMNASTGHAQDGAQRQAAARAYDQGTAAFLAEDFAGAARWFETADRLAPAAPAIRQAIRSHRRAGNDPRAATLALKLLDTYPNDEASAQTAREVLGELAQRYFRVDVECEGCAITLDGTVAIHRSFFLEPDTEHEVVASFETGEVSRTVSGSAARRQRLALRAPPPIVSELPADPEETQETRAVTGPTTVAPSPTPQTSRGTPRALFFTALALTVAAGGFTIWSGIDVLNQNEVYEDTANMGNLTLARELLDQGQSAELRTNIAIGATGAFAIATFVLAFTTDWGGDDDAVAEDTAARRVRARPSLFASRDQVSLSISGRF